MLQIYVNVLPSSATPRFLSLYHTILPLFMPVHMFELIFVNYKDPPGEVNIAIERSKTIFFSLENLNIFGGFIPGLSLMPGKNQQQPGQDGWV